MINTLFHAHSGLRFLVLLAAVVALIVQTLGASGRQPYGRPSRIAMAVFTGLLDLQLLLGLVMVVLGCFYPALMGHLMMMVLAVAAAHGCSVYAKRNADGRRSHGVALVGVILALALIVGGIAAIGRTPFSSSGAPTCPAAQPPSPAGAAA
jgi:heme A synthase